VYATPHVLNVIEYQREYLSRAQTYGVDIDETLLATLQQVQSWEFTDIHTKNSQGKHVLKHHITPRQTRHSIAQDFNTWDSMYNSDTFHHVTDTDVVDRKGVAHKVLYAGDQAYILATKK
jgi:hypothetical protein